MLHYWSYERRIRRSSAVHSPLSGAIHKYNIHLVLNGRSWRRHERPFNTKYRIYLSTQSSIGQAQALQGQKWIDMLDFRDDRSHQLTQAAMSNYLYLAFIGHTRNLLAQAANQALH